MPLLKYSGSLPKVEVGGYGHFAPGEEKTVDDRTAIEFDCPPCAAEGWSVTFEDGKKKASHADTEATITPAKDESPRGPRSRTNQD